MVGGRRRGRGLRARRVLRLERETFGRRLLGRAQHQHLQSHVGVHPDALLPVERVGPPVDHQQRTAADRVVRVAVGRRRALLDAADHLGVRLAVDVHAVHLHDPVALPETGALGRAAPVHLADELAAGERQTAVGRRRGRF